MDTRNRKIYSKERAWQKKIFETDIVEESRGENTNFTIVSAQGWTAQKSLIEEIKGRREERG